MKISPALFAYIFFAVVYFIATFIPNETLIYISKPAMVISLILHFWNSSPHNSNLKFNSALFFYLIGVILNLFDDSVVLTYVVLSKLFIHIIVLTVVLKILSNLKYKIIDNANVVYIGLTAFLLACLVYLSLFLIFDEKYELYSLMVVYSIFLAFLCICSTAYYTLQQNQASFYILLASFGFIFTDLFYAIYYYYLDILFFRIVSVFCNIITIYFLTMFFIKFDKNNTNLSIKKLDEI